MRSVQDQIVAYDLGKVKGPQDYEQLLRALGQALAKESLQKFELTPAANGFHIRATAASLLEPSVVERLADRGRPYSYKLPNRKNGDDKTPLFTESAKAPIEIQFMVQDIQKLEIDGRARRVDAHSMANAASLSQVLRCLVAYLNQKRARLLRLSRDGETVSLEYETSLGSQIKEAFNANGLYDMWVRMYMQRAGRVSH
jgi:hypothetical protein